MKIKKVISIILVLVLAMSLFGCKKDKDTDVTDDIPGKISGGFDYSEAAACLSEEESKLFNDAVGVSVGAKVEPICVLGKQIVAGTNYLYLAVSTPVVANPVSSLMLYTISVDLDGKASVMKTEEAELSEETGESGNELSGGWSTVDTSAECSLPDGAKKAFEGAKNGYTGLSFEIRGYLGKQIVSGTNYLIVCKATTSTAEPVSKMNVIKVYSDLDGNASISEIYSIAAANSEK